MLKHVEKALSRDDTDIQLLLCSRLGSSFSRLKSAEAHSISSLSSTGHWREQERRSRTGEDRCSQEKSSADEVFGIRWKQPDVA